MVESAFHKNTSRKKTCRSDFFVGSLKGALGADWLLY